MFNFNLENFRLEAAKYLKIGLPILGSQIVMYGLTTTDYIMAGLYSPEDLAGVGIAASIFNPIYFGGFLMHLERIYDAKKFTYWVF